jgi:hypothetical protein
MSSNQKKIKEHFQSVYITSSEITERMGITRAGFLYARQRGKIPEAPIVVCNGRIFIWLRSEIEPIIKAWKQEIDNRKSPH